MAMTMHGKVKCAVRGGEALDVHHHAAGPVEAQLDMRLSELITDLMHLADVFGADFDAATARARQMFVAEQAAHAQDAAPANRVAPAKPRRTPAAKPLARTTKRTVREPAPASRRPVVSGACISS